LELGEIRLPNYFYQLIVLNVNIFVNVNIPCSLATGFPLSFRTCLPAGRLDAESRVSRVNLPTGRQAGIQGFPCKRESSSFLWFPSFKGTASGFPEQACLSADRSENDDRRLHLFLFRYPVVSAAVWFPTILNQFCPNSHDIIAQYIVLVATNKILFLLFRLYELKTSLR
jgi:hypothetical protein